MIIKFVMKFLLTCLPSGLTVAAPDAFGRIPGVVYVYESIHALDLALVMITNPLTISGVCNTLVEGAQGVDI